MAGIDRIFTINGDDNKVVFKILADHRLEIFVPDPSNHDET